MRTDVVQKSLVFRDDGLILLLRRSDTDIRRPLQWDFPGGVLDDGESLEDGIRREIKEESGIEVNDVKVFFSKTESAEWVVDEGVTSQKNVVRLYYTAHTSESEVNLSNEHSEYCWVTLEEAHNLLKYPRHKEVIQWAVTNNLSL